MILMGVIDTASNLKTGENPPYTLEDFFTTYPQFKPNTEGSYVVPVTILNIYLNLANACVKQARWHDMWAVAMGLFIAHFATLWLQGTADPNNGAASVLAAGQARGLLTSKSVDGVSASIDYNTITQDLDGWAAWKLTTYGIQLATFGRMVGKGNMYVW